MKLFALAPILWTKNLQETINFYETVLGFSCRTKYPDFASLYREDVEIMIVLPTEEPEDCKDPDTKEVFFTKPSLTGSIYICTDDVDALWEKVKDKAKVVSALEDRAYLMRDFSIRDNNGYELVFGQNISSKV